MGDSGPPERPATPAGSPAPPPPAAAGALSADGSWLWDGQRWVQHSSAPPVPAPPVRRTSLETGRWITGWCFLGVLLLGMAWFVLGILVDIAQSGAGGTSNPPDWTVNGLFAFAVATPLLLLIWIALSLAVRVRRGGAHRS
jgi:hypothetical protein